MIDVSSSVKNGVLRSYVADKERGVDALIEFDGNISSTFPSFSLIDFTDNDSEQYDSDCQEFEYPRIFKHRNIHVETIKESREEADNGDDDDDCDYDNHLVFNVCFGNNLNEAILNSLRGLALKKIDEDMFLESFNKIFHRLLNHQTERGGFTNSDFDIIPYPTRKLISLITTGSINSDVIDNNFSKRYETMKTICDMNVIMVRCNNRVKIIPPAIDYLCSTLMVNDRYGNDCNTVMIDDDGYLVTGKGLTKCNRNAQEIQHYVKPLLEKLENNVDISGIDKMVSFITVKYMLIYAPKEFKKIEQSIVSIQSMLDLDIEALLLTILADGLHKKSTTDEMPW